MGRAVISSAAFGCWVLRTPASAYVVHLGGEDVPLTAHWGAPVDDETALALARVPLGTARGWESALDGDHLRLCFAELTRDLRLLLHYRVVSDVVERWAELRAGEPVEVLRADSAAWCPPRREEYRLSSVHGRWAAEWQLRREPLTAGLVRLGSRRTTTSPTQNPWFALDDGTATETAGVVWSAALAWSGTWHIDVERQPAGRVVATAGAAFADSPWTLAAGETHTTPVSAGLWTGDGSEPPAGCGIGTSGST
ncbi:glycoside hydrolase family 36 N-terminal domain-containing protein [Dactylosporangium sp. AC04546]|uniref:glycoside hydrolase family 36 N-terminal domain-containing protein n=1 Tax=Dactylosporangium sp. AC04546 TaxID=2862460 RepID=UPI001EDDED56|nr:glycoside hydrolase family 36 N-terminal domain-containing protein [Dactylosporangium sp. AC04546]WVK87646.1 glycoside hydrolase family 36 N-terminal domain-containing protein [Dactylosporangium sp. AC04546]